MTHSLQSTSYYYIRSKFLDMDDRIKKSCVKIKNQKNELQTPSSEESYAIYIAWLS